MQSPLPDATTLEAGIIEDARPSRLSRVHDNVRNLLRNSMRSSVHSSPRIVSPVASPRSILTHPALWRERQSEVLPSPSAESVSSNSTVDSASSTVSKSSQHSTDMLLPARDDERVARVVRQQSMTFNNRAVAALDHPDLDHSSMSDFVRHREHQRQQGARKCSKRHRLRQQTNTMEWLLCVTVSMALAALLATYVALATTTSNQPVVFHVLFIIGILLVAIIMIHTIARLCLATSMKQHRSKRSRHHRHGGRARSQPRISDREEAHFTPDTPVRVQCTDDVPLDQNEAQPSSAVDQPPEVWNRDVNPQLANPPPAYGRWRGSVRADPDLLHWQPVSPVEEDTPAIPSPTYEERPLASQLGDPPPSYRTKASPARTKAGSITTPAGGRSVRGGPEMVEGRGIGVMQSIEE